MVKKRIDNRIRVLIENGVNTKQRSMFVVIGDKGRDQVLISMFTLFFFKGASFLIHILIQGCYIASYAI